MSPEKIHGGGDERLRGPESRVQANCTDTVLSPLLYSPAEALPSPKAAVDAQGWLQGGALSCSAGHQTQRSFRVSSPGWSAVSTKVPQEEGEEWEEDEGHASRQGQRRGPEETGGETRVRTESAVESWEVGLGAQPGSHW